MFNYLSPSVNTTLLVFAFFGLLTFLYIVKLVVGLYRNYCNARQTGLPILFTPFDPFGLGWIVLLFNFGHLLASFRCLRLLSMTWVWQDNDKWHRLCGRSFVLVSPYKCTIHTNDPVAIDWVLGRRKEFPKPSVYEGLDLFGRNVDTVNGAEWARHRKLTAPCFNERVSSFVWTESVRQSKSMLSSWLSSPDGRVTSMIDDTRIIALHVLYAAGFGTTHEFSSGKRVAEPGHTMSHRDALLTVLDNIVVAIIMTKFANLMHISKFVLGKKFSSILLAINEFRMYTDEAVAAERKVLAAEGGKSKHNLMSTLIRTSDQAKSENTASAVRLTDDEIKGNIFIFNLAGHDTTANTLGYAFALLVCHPEVQDWVREEIDAVLGHGRTRYEEVFPRLTRVLAVMYETLRLYGPVTIIPRAVLAPLTPLPFSSDHPSPVPIPPNTDITLKINAMHTSASHFPDPTVWTPKRWIVISSSGSPADEKLVSETKTFIPWSAGARVCPGMKMAQVEFVGVLATVLRAVKVEPVSGETEEEKEDARRKLLGVLRDSNADGPTLKVTRPEEVCLRAVPRKVPSC